MKKKIITDVIAALLIILFVYAAISKLRTYKTFEAQLVKSPYVTDFAGLAAWALPLSELVVAVLLIASRTRLIGMYGAYLLMFLFTGYIYAILHYSYFVPCSCGGILSKMNWETHFVFNIIFTSMALIGIFLVRPISKAAN
ncbi:Methylamine utilization protein MauE [compost metagenome]